MKNHEAFFSGILSLLTNEKGIIFFDKDRPGKIKLNRLVLLQSLTVSHLNGDDCDGCQQARFLFDMLLLLFNGMVFMLTDDY